MATYTLTDANASEIFNLAADGTVQVIISTDSIFDNGTFALEYETEVEDVYMRVPDTSSAEPYSRIFTFKAGNIRAKLNNAGDNSSLVVDVR